MRLCLSFSHLLLLLLVVVVLAFLTGKSFGELTVMRTQICELVSMSNGDLIHDTPP